MSEITIPDIKGVFEHNGKEYLATEVARLEKLMAEAAENKKEIEVLKGTVIDVLMLLGLLDEKTKGLKPELKSGEDSYMKHILKSLKDVILLLGKSSLSKSAKAEMLEKFAFVGNVLPLIEKYAN